MAMSKYAKASIVEPQITGRAWSTVRTAARAEAEVSENLVARASEIFGKPFDPANYLLTHATIVASVDTYEPTGMKLGSVMEGGFRVNRKFANFRVKLGTDKYINNNLDCWSRGVLLKSYQTFIGAHNFVEHVQVEELSKGRIIDAVARDIGDSVYVDILIATDRQHTELVEAIESGKMSTLSMGCTVDGTICTKCGHWAADETEMCPHIKYEKGNVFFDKNGRQHRVAELCGHISIDPTAGVHFIEGSWVGTPAFTGAVLRNIVSLYKGTKLGKAASAILAIPSDQWTKGLRRKAAALAFGHNHFMAGWDDDEGEDEGDDEEEAPAEGGGGGEDPFKDLEDELTTHLKDRVRKRVKDEMSQQDMDDALGPEDPSSSNENLVKESFSLICRTASSDAEFFDRLSTLHAAEGVKIPVPLYRAAVRLGSLMEYGNMNQFSRACQAALGRRPTQAEARTLVRLGKLVSRRRPGSSREQSFPGSRH